MEPQQVGRFLVVAGVSIAVLGGLFLLGGAVGLGRLPGDISLRRGNTRVYMPLATCIVLSIVATVALNLFFRR